MPRPQGQASVEGIAFWSSLLCGWDAAREAFRGEAASTGEPAPRPVPSLLPATERRRAPDSVALALEVGLQACRSAGRDQATLPAVFASTHGDLAITDYLCALLAREPAQMSPTRFHNSVHNAAAGYWTIGACSHAACTALAAGPRSFCQGLMEALVQVACESAPVLLVAYDTESRGPLAQVSPSVGMLGAGLVLAPPGSERSRCALEWRIIDHAAPTMPVAEASRSAVGNAMAAALPLFEALAQSSPAVVLLDLAPDLSLEICLAP